MDLVVTAATRPAAGETIIGNSFKTVPGGKGANQAIAAARLGAEVTMIGRVGDDEYGALLLENLNQNQINTVFVEPVPHQKSGTAHITLAEGDNSIIVIKGANDDVTPSYIEKATRALMDADIILIQQEIPEETVEFTADICQKLGKSLLLNPAPARTISNKIIDQATFITPNEHEYEVLFNGEERSEVLSRYPNKILITEGKNGVRFFNGTHEVVVPAFVVEAVDTTGAGDTFNAAFAVAIAEGKNINDSIRFANRAASLSVMKFGAQGGMPTRVEVERNLNV